MRGESCRHHPRIESAIADYDAQQFTEIDHAAQTWSVTPFADIAKSRMDLDARIGNKTPAGDAKVTALGRQAASGGDGFLISEPHRRMEIAFNRGVALSRAAAEVLIGQRRASQGPKIWSWEL